MKRKKFKKPTASYGKCRDCGEKTAVPFACWSHASKPRCSKCGGMLDRLGRKRTGFRHAWGTAYR